MEKTAATLRWGIVGTGGIANRMAPMLRQAALANLAAVSSRRMSTAKEFAATHDVPATFDDWGRMLESDAIDAVYVATPTSVREEISIAAARRGKHVLAEKPFASAASVNRIAAACRENDVALMDGTHFVHHPRTAVIHDYAVNRLGRPLVLDTTFQFRLDDPTNIRLRPDLEPMGAIGDAGWYNMRAIAEFLPPDVALREAAVFARRHPDTNAVSSAVGVLRFDGDAVSSFNCGFESGALTMDLRLTGPDGAVYADDFVLPPSGESHFRFRRGGLGSTEQIATTAGQPAAVQMFDDFALAAADPGLREPWMRAIERTQQLLDAVWLAANDGA